MAHISYLFDFSSEVVICSFAPKYVSCMVTSKYGNFEIEHAEDPY